MSFLDVWTMQLHKREDSVQFSKFWPSDLGVQSFDSVFYFCDIVLSVVAKCKFAFKNRKKWK